MKLFAYGAVPKDGGTYTFYQSLRPGLQSLGWDMRCIAIGVREHAALNPDFLDEGFVSIAPNEHDPRRLSREFLAWCECNKVSVFMPVNSRPMINAIPHTPHTIRIITRCADSTDQGYRRTTYRHEYVSRIVASTPRHMEDLPSYGVMMDKIVLIPHGLDLTRFRSPIWPSDRHLQLLFVGRLYEQKGILILPQILAHLDKRRVPYHLTIIGSGMHEDILRHKLAPMMISGKASFEGTVQPNKIPEILHRSDILLFPSHHEGFGFVLIEGMAAGCVPVASRLPGVTDFIIYDGITGILCPIGDPHCFAKAISRLHEDRQLLKQMGIAAVEAAQERFSQERMAADYAKVLDAIVNEPESPLPVRAWKEFQEVVLAPTKWHDFIPRPAKRQLRRLWHSLRYRVK